MENGSTFKRKLAQHKLPEKIEALLHGFYDSFRAAVATELPQFDILLDLVKEQIHAPFAFQPYHQKIVHPFDYYRFGVEFFRPLVDEQNSTVLGADHLQEIQGHLRAGHNVVFLANHQIEADPQAISILLDGRFPGLASEMIFVAGERVITDPVAVPFSMGRNLLCIYSKRYIDNPPEYREAKQNHNKKTMAIMRSLLKEGGKCIYVAPSGGRDRSDASGAVRVTPFDPQSIEMFYLMAKKGGTPTFFYPMALATFRLLPPPQTVQIELGELRSTYRSAIHLAVGSVLDMETFPGSEVANKHLKRQARAEYIWRQVCEDYRKLERGMKNQEIE